MKKSFQMALLWLLASPFIFGPVLVASTLPDVRQMVFQGSVTIAALIAFTPWLSTHSKSIGALRALLWPFDLIPMVEHKRLKNAKSIAQAGMVFRDAGFGSGKVMRPYVISLVLTQLALMAIAELFPGPILGIWVNAVFMFSALAVLPVLLALMCAMLMARSVGQY